MQSVERTTRGRSRQHAPATASAASAVGSIVAAQGPSDLGSYQFQVVAGNIADAVMSIGGLIFDRAMAGWDVSVVVAAHCDRDIDDRPIRILGGESPNGWQNPDMPGRCPARTCSRSRRT